MNNLHDQKNLSLTKWWGKTLIVSCLIVILGGVAGGRDASAGDLKQQAQEQRTDMKEPKTTLPPSVEKNGHAKEPKETQVSPKRLYLLYDAIDVGMTESEVVAVSGEPGADVISETDVENFGHVRSLVFTHDDGASDVTAVIHKGRVKLVVLNHYTGDRSNWLITKAKM